MLESLIINENERALDAELRMLRSCLAIIQDSGYSKKTKSEKMKFAKVYVNFIKNNIHKYPKQKREEFRGEFERLRELFNTLSSFFVSTNKKS